MFKLGYTDISGQSFCQYSENVEELVKIATRMSRLGLIVGHCIELSDKPIVQSRDEPARGPRNTVVMWAIPSNERVKVMG